MFHLPFRLHRLQIMYSFSQMSPRKQLKNKNRTSNVIIEKKCVLVQFVWVVSPPCCLIFVQPHIVVKLGWSLFWAMAKVIILFGICLIENSAQIMALMIINLAYKLINKHAKRVNILTAVFLTKQTNTTIHFLNSSFSNMTKIRQNSNLPVLCLLIPKVNSPCLHWTETGLYQSQRLCCSWSGLQSGLSSVNPCDAALWFQCRLQWAVWSLAPLWSKLTVVQAKKKKVITQLKITKLKQLVKSQSLAVNDVLHPIFLNGALNLVLFNNIQCLTSSSSLIFVNTRKFEFDASKLGDGKQETVENCGIKNTCLEPSYHLERISCTRVMMGQGSFRFKTH